MKKIQLMRIRVVGAGGFLLLATSACSTGPRSSAPESRFSDLSEKPILARSTASTKRPAWIEGETILREGDGWLVLGFSASPDRKGPAGAIAAAELRARKELGTTVMGRLESIIEIDEPSAIPERKLRSELLQDFGTRLEAGLRPVTPSKLQYWERLPQSYRGFARVAVSSDDLRRAVLTALGSESRAGKRPAAAVLSQVVRRHLEALLNLDSSEVLPLGQMSPAGQN